jgi:hypothetical protein
MLLTQRRATRKCFFFCVVSKDQCLWTNGLNTDTSRGLLASKEENFSVIGPAGSPLMERAPPPPPKLYHEVKSDLKEKELLEDVRVDV